MKKKTKIILFVFIFFWLWGCFVSVSDENENESIKKNDSVKKTEKTHDVEVDNTNLDYLGCEFINDEYHGKVLAAYFDFENLSEENKSFGFTYTVKAFQDGVEIENAMFAENEFHKNAFKEIQPNTKLKVGSFFECKNTEIPIILEVYEWISFDNEKLMEIEIKPE